MAGSVWGGGDQGYGSTWATTLNAIDDLAMGTCDNLLILDETGSASGDSGASADIILPAIYRLAGGVEKTRKRARDTAAAPAEPWRCFLLGSSEKTLPELASDAGKKLMSGHVVRFISLPIAGTFEMGIFDELPPGASSPAELAVHLKAASRQFYGTPSHEFLRRLLADLTADSKRIAWLKKRVDYFMRWLKSSGFSGPESRIAHRFSIVYAAGALASKYGVLPWGMKVIRDAVKHWYDASQADRLEQAREMRQRAEARFTAWVSANSRDIVDLDGNGKQPSAKAYRDHRQNPAEMIIPGSTFRDEVCAEIGEEAMVTGLDEAKRLRRGADGKATMPRRIPGLPGKVRCFVILKQIGA